MSTPPTYATEEGSNSFSTRRRIEILWEESLSAIAHKSLHLPLRDRQMVLNIIRQFEDMEESGESDDAMPEGLR